MLYGPANAMGTSQQQQKKAAAAAAVAAMTSCGSCGSLRMRSACKALAASNEHTEANHWPVKKHAAKAAAAAALTTSPLRLTVMDLYLYGVALVVHEQDDGRGAKADHAAHILRCTRFAACREAHAAGQTGCLLYTLVVGTEHRQEAHSASARCTSTTQCTLMHMYCRKQ